MHVCNIPKSAEANLDVDLKIIGEQDLPARKTNIRETTWGRKYKKEPDSEGNPLTSGWHLIGRED